MLCLNYIPLLSLCLCASCQGRGGLFTPSFHPLIPVLHIKGKWVVPRPPSLASLTHSGSITAWISLIRSTARAALPVASAVPADHQVLGLITACVKVEVVLGHQVHIVEYEAVPFFLFESFQIAHIQELGSIKLFTSSLWRREIKIKRALEMRFPSVLPSTPIPGCHITLVNSQDNTHQDPERKCNDHKRPVWASRCTHIYILQSKSIPLSLARCLMVDNMLRKTKKFNDSTFSFCL